MTIKNNLSGGVKVVEAIAPDNYAAAATPSNSDVDCRGFRWAYLILHVANSATSDGTTFTVSSSPDGGSYTLITDDTSNLTGGASPNVTATMTIAAATDGVFVAEIDLDQFDNWLQFDMTVGATGGMDASALVILSGADNGLQSVPLSSTLEFQITTATKAAY